MTLLAVGSHGFAGPALNWLVHADIDLTFLSLCMCVCVLGWECSVIVYQIEALFSYHFKQFISHHANGSFRGLRR